MIYVVADFGQGPKVLGIVDPIPSADEMNRRNEKAGALRWWLVSADSPGQAWALRSVVATGGAS